MWNDGLYLLWSHISKLYYEDLDNGLKIMNKLTNDHIVLNPYSVILGVNALLEVAVKIHLLQMLGINKVTILRKTNTLSVLISSVKSDEVLTK